MYWKLATLLLCFVLVGCSDDEAEDEDTEETTTTTTRETTTTTQQSARPEQPVPNPELEADILATISAAIPEYEVSQFEWLSEPEGGYPQDFLRIWGSDREAAEQWTAALEDRGVDISDDDQEIITETCVPHIKRLMYDAWEENPDPSYVLESVMAEAPKVAEALSSILQQSAADDQ